ncbi:MAG: TolC family protein [Myxococcales bacterium]|nr:TolC family protein [Myxococcales bacterium]
MRALLALALALAAPSAHAAPLPSLRPEGEASRRESGRFLSLADAVDLAMAQEPLLVEARIVEDRSKLGVLRAQLDRVSLKVDGSLQELWNKQNIAGPSINVCTASGVTFTSDKASCEKMGGTSAPAAEQSPSAGQGLFNLSANLNAPLFTGFRISSNVRRAQLTQESAVVQLRQVRRETALAVARAYWGVRRYQLLGEVQLQSLERMKQAEAVAEGRASAGLAPPIDRNRAHLRRVLQQATLADLEGQARELVAQFGVTLGVGDAVILTDAPSFPDAAPPSVEELIAQARSGRTEVAGAKLQTAAQHQLVRIAQSGYYPQVGVYGLLQFGNNPYLPGVGARSASAAANPFGNLAGNLTLGATLSMNFLDTLNTWTDARDAKLEERRLTEEERRQGRIVEADVRLAHARLSRFHGRRVPLAAARVVAADNAVILEGRYRSGDALVLEMLEAQNDLANIELQLADVTAQLQLAWLEIDAALGRTVGARP